MLGGFFLYYLNTIQSFDAAHFLREYEGKCASIHGHTWEVKVTVKGTKLNDQGLLIDFGLLKSMLKEVLNYFDHKLINELPQFGENKLNPTAENLAFFIYRSIEEKLPKEVILDQVEVWESPKSSAVYKNEKE